MSKSEQIKDLISFVKMLRQDEYIILDTETTGLKRGEICQIAIVRSDGKVLLDTLVRTVSPIPQDATRVHGITDEMTLDSPTWKEIIPVVFRLVEGRDLVVYNAIYDRKMMHQSSEAHGLAKTEWKELADWWCAMEMFAEIYGEYDSYRGSYRWQKLSDAAAYYHIYPTGAHTALADCMTTREICMKMADHAAGDA